MKPSGGSFARAMSDALRKAPVLPIDAALIEACIDPRHGPTDALFAAARRDGLAALPQRDRVGRLGGVTGHIGESVVELILDQLGYSMLWHFTGPMSGGHGIDLLALSADAKVVAVEVKATLRPGRWPRPSRQALDQLSSAWLNSADNPGMANWDLQSSDVYGAVAVLNFASSGWKCILTADFTTAHAVHGISELAELSWLDGDHAG